ncbi:MAG: heme-binding protein [Lutibacter sp.]|uniref:GlcG/HbpS family heme-binding protein n=1 Tax=Lutibacter sp. TaxID=1925666 RepID=UPI0019E305F0|nr:heme-binding protein [Lutibacter sp.]NOR28216.1 heme-binding protein [Lutibacter sp.]
MICSFIGFSQNGISLEQAEKMIAVAKEKAISLDTKMNISIVDAGANLVAFVRMDGAWLGSADISLKKAKTARYFNMNTGIIGSLSQPGGSLYNIEHSNGGLITFPGGVPIKNEAGEVIGAIGVSGSSVENDHAVAEAGASTTN